jgi:hypothetical protein
VWIEGKEGEGLRQQAEKSKIFKIDQKLLYSTIPNAKSFVF